MENHKTLVKKRACKNACVQSLTMTAHFFHDEDVFGDFSFARDVFKNFSEGVNRIEHLVRIEIFYYFGNHFSSFQQGAVVSYFATLVLYGD